jgi:hypothetical protein
MTSTIEPTRTQPKVRPARRWRFPTQASLLVVGGLPILLALAEAIRSPRLNFNDFWLVIGLTTTPGGGLDPSKITTLYNGHPIETVSLVFWLDAKLFAGTNDSLGVLSVLLAGAILAALWTMLPARLTGTARAAVLVALSALVFSSAAMTYYGIGMLGVQWLLGLAPSVVAIAFAHRGRTVPAALFGLLASIGHGSGLPVWPALALIAWLRRDARWRIAVPLAGGLVVLVLWRVVVPASTDYQKPALIGADTPLATTLAALGKVWAAQSLDLAILTGAVSLGGLIMLGWPGLTDRVRGPGPVPADAGWFGLAAQMLLAAAMIGLGRGGYGTEEGLAHRYAGVPLLFTCALLVLAITRGPGWLRTRAVPVALTVALASYAIGSTTAGDTRRQYPVTPTLAVAMRTGATSVVRKEFSYPEFLATYRSLGIYPFTDDFTLGCRGPELGGQVDLATVTDLPAPNGARNTTGYLETLTGQPGIVGDTELTGWAMIDGRQAECVLVVDPTGIVVGGGSVGVPRKDVLTTAWGTGRSGFQAVAGPGTRDGSILLRYRGTYYRITAMNKPPAG